MATPGPQLTGSIWQVLTFGSGPLTVFSPCSSAKAVTVSLKDRNASVGRYVNVVPLSSTVPYPSSYLSCTRKEQALHKLQSLDNSGCAILYVHSGDLLHGRLTKQQAHLQWSGTPGLAGN